MSAFVLGIRAEDPRRLWERRVPCLPADVAKLLGDPSLQPLRIIVQPSEKRCVPDSAYIEAGAEIKKDLSEADAIIGVKEVPAVEILRDDKAAKRTYLAFSHVHKAQGYNMPLLAEMLASKSKFIDWELITNDQGERLTAFGTLAGVAGCADGLSLFGVRCLALGMQSPFLHLPRPFVHPTSDDFNAALRDLGRRISEYGTPAGLGAFTIAVVGTGRVGTGAKQVLDETGVCRWIKPKELKTIAEDENADRRFIYAAQIGAADHLVRKDRGSFSREEVKRRPDLYTSRFADDLAPFCTMVVNGSYWAPGSPRLLTVDQHVQLRRQLAGRGWEKKRFLSIVDVSCDFGGGVEFVERATTIEEPVFYLDADGNEHKDFSHPNSTQVCSIEILPTELPVPASDHFSVSALPFFRALIRPELADPALSDALERATLLSNGELRPKHAWLSEHLPKSKASLPQKKRVLLLGSGLVAGPAVDTFLARPDIELTIASGEPASSAWLANGVARVFPLDLDNQEKTAALVSRHDIVVSLLPAPLHPHVARLCLQESTHLVTASYAGPEMRELHDEAVSKGLIFLNELGLDPGIDHLGAMAMLDGARANGEEITGFTSFCGGLPAPESSDVPLSYKFSWAPRGVLTAAGNPALFRIDGQDKNIAGDDLLRKPFSTVPITSSLAIEGLANRNSLSYLDAYDLSSDLPTVLRGTLRYAGTARLLNSFRCIGLLDADSFDKPLSSWLDLVPATLSRLGVKTSSEEGRLQALDRLLGAEGTAAAPLDEVLSSLQWLSLWPAAQSAEDLPPLPRSATSPLDAFATLLQHKLRYLPGERDMVILKHEIGLRLNGQDVVDSATLLAFGDPHDARNRLAHSAMAKTVGCPVALGALHVLDGGMKGQAGVLLPTGRDVYETLLSQLERQGIVFKESRRSGKVWTPAV